MKTFQTYFSMTFLSGYFSRLTSDQLCSEVCLQSGLPAPQPFHPSLPWLLCFSQFVMCWAPLTSGTHPQTSPHGCHFPSVYHLSSLDLEVFQVTSSWSESAASLMYFYSTPLIYPYCLCTDFTAYVDTPLYCQVHPEQGLAFKTSVLQSSPQCLAHSGGSSQC